MPLTTLDATPALVVIDLQKGIVAIPTAHPTRAIIDRTAEIAAAFRRHSWPVVLVHVTGAAPGRTDTGPFTRDLPPDWAELVPELGATPEDHVVTKQRWGAFLGTDLDAWLRGRGVTQIVLTGVATSAGVESTARSAHDLGYHVVLVLDAMTDRDVNAHRHSAEKIFPRLGETTTTAELLARLERGAPPAR
jgi:nicotinamidase-related amidase